MTGCFPSGTSMNIASVCPGRHELVAALLPLLRRHRVPDVVLPDAVDLEVPHGNTLVAQIELLHDAATGLVAGDDRDLHPVEPELLEPEPQHQHYRLGHEALACP